MTDKPLADQLALVTGASRGIGAATALALARQRFATGRQEPGYHQEERALLERVTTARATFLRALSLAR